MSAESAQLAKQLGMDAQTVIGALSRWPNDPMRKIIEHKLKAEIETGRNKLETVSSDEVKQAQGDIAGIRRALGIILNLKN